MSGTHQQSPSRTRPGDGAIACECCGKTGATAIGDRVLCRDCYFACSSCCPEFGGDDLWQAIDSEQADNKENP